MKRTRENNNIHDDDTMVETNRRMNELQSYNIKLRWTVSGCARMQIQITHSKRASEKVVAHVMTQHDLTR